MKQLFIIFFITCVLLSNASALESDTFTTSKGELKITFIGHGTLMMEFNGKTIHIDPWSRFEDYIALPKADLILITHEHGDHLDADLINTLSTGNTQLVMTKICHEKVGNGIVMNNGDKKTVMGIEIEAVPAYNIVHTRGEGKPYHPKGNGNGYVLGFGDKRVYIAGDTENIPEMAELENIDIAFIPMNLPYTMTPAMAADAARKIQPKILYPYHYGETDTNLLLQQLKNDKNIEVRIRQLQ